MDAFHTFSVNPKHRENFYIADAELLVMIISALKWRQLNGNIFLFTDSYGEKYIDNLGIRYIWNYCYKSLDDYHKLEINEDVYWAGAKLFSLQRMQSNPCVGLDIDFIVWKKLDWSRYNNTAVISIHQEDVNNQIYPDQSFFSKPMQERYAKYDWQVKACNAAFMLFNDEIVRQEYIKLAFEFMQDEPINYDSYANGLPYMVFAEQRILPMVIENMGKKIEYFSEDVSSLFSEQNSTFTHLWGYKQQLKDNPSLAENFCADCVERIQYDFPDIYLQLTDQEWFSRYCK